MDKEQRSQLTKDWWINHPNYKRQKASEATKEKMRLAKLGKTRKFSKEHIENIRIAMLNNKNAIKTV